jgi:hypothetical protein
MACERAQNQIPKYRAMVCHLSGCHRCARRFARTDGQAAGMGTPATARASHRTGRTPLRMLP